MAFLIDKLTLHTILLLPHAGTHTNILDMYGTVPFGPIAGMRKINQMVPGCLGYTKNAHQLSDRTRLSQYLTFCGIILFGSDADVISFGKLPGVKGSYYLFTHHDDLQRVRGNTSYFKADDELTITLSSSYAASKYASQFSALRLTVNLVTVNSDDVPIIASPPPVPLVISSAIDDDSPFLCDSVFVSDHLHSHGIILNDSLDQMIVNGDFAEVLTRLPGDCKRCNEIDSLYQLISDVKPDEAVSGLCFCDKPISAWRLLREDDTAMFRLNKVPEPNSRDLPPLSPNISNMFQPLLIKDNQDEPFFPFWMVLKRERQKQFYVKGPGTMTIPQWDVLVRRSTLFVTTTQEDGIPMRDYYLMTLKDAPLWVVVDILC